jgi:hypothetical protein
VRQISIWYVIEIGVAIQYLKDESLHELPFSTITLLPDCIFLTRYQKNYQVGSTRIHTANQQQIRQPKLGGKSVSATQQ